MIADVSKHQGKIDWDKLAPKLDFVIIKASGLYGNGADPYYAHNVEGAVAHGVPFHTYHFLYCVTEVQAKRDAKLFFDTVKAVGKWPLFWVLDCESQWGIKDNQAAPIARIFENELRRLAREQGPGDTRVALYVAQEKYHDWAFDYGHFDYIWIPGYGDKYKPPMPCDIWQYTSKGTLPGINGNVDLNKLMGTKPLSFFTTGTENTDTTDTDGGDTEMANDYRKYILSTGTHYISNSGSDENSGTHGGAAGDQNGKEWQLKPWYKRPWTVVLRYPDINVGTLIAQLSIDAALNNKIGYDQYQRDTYWKQLKAVGYFPSKITTPCEEDCTAGVNANVHAAGYLLNIPALKAIKETGIRSSNMRKAFVAAGFKALTDSKYLTSGNYLLPGDILLYENHHAAANVTVGKSVRSSYTYHDVMADLDHYTPVAYKLGDRDLKRGCEGEDVKELQADLMKLGYALPKYGADGDYGSETEKAVKQFQLAHSLPNDGVMNVGADYDTLFKALDGDKPQEYGHVEITGGSVNIRSAPGYDSKVYGTAHNGDILPYQGVTQEAEGKPWYLVIWENQNAWVSSKYSRMVN